jgi:hypothetical protein
MTGPVNLSSDTRVMQPVNLPVFKACQPETRSLNGRLKSKTINLQMAVDYHHLGTRIASRAKLTTVEYLILRTRGDKLH